MKKEIGFVAVGQAGGNIGSALEEKGFNVLYLNTSSEDLSTLETAKHKYHIKGGEGCHKDRDKAKQLLAGNLDEIIDQVKSCVKEQIIFVIFSTGGGTGSGMGPYLVDIIGAELERKVGAVAVLPGKDETVKAFMNAYECMKELADIDDMAASFFIDNNRHENKFYLNSMFAGQFESVIGIPDSSKDVRGNLDRAELKEILCTRGAAAMCKVSKEKFNGIQKMINVIRSGIYAMDPNRVIKYIGISAPDKLPMEELKKEFGAFLDCYQGYNKEHVLGILSGMSFPFEMVLKMRERIEAEKSDIMKNVQAVHNNPLKDDVNFLAGSDTKQTKAEPERKRRSCRDMLAKYK